MDSRATVCLAVEEKSQHLPLEDSGFNLVCGRNYDVLSARINNLMKGIIRARMASGSECKRREGGPSGWFILPILSTWSARVDA